MRVIEIMKNMVTRLFHSLLLSVWVKICLFIYSFIFSVFFFFLLFYRITFWTFCKIKPIDRNNHYTAYSLHKTIYIMLCKFETRARHAFLLFAERYTHCVGLEWWSVWNLPLVAPTCRVWVVPTHRTQLQEDAGFMKLNQQFSQNCNNV